MGALGWLVAAACAVGWWLEHYARARDVVDRAVADLDRHRERRVIRAARSSLEVPVQRRPE